MSILVVSVSHKTAPMDLLSQLALSPDATNKMLSALVASEHVEEAVVLSTCNRMEVYASVSRFHGGLAALTETVEQVAGISVETLQDNCAVFYDEAAVSHCFSVTSGLDSMVAGEHQILGQVRQSLNQAQSEGTVGTTLNALFQQALRIAKRVQNETAAGNAGRSLVTAALAELAARGIEIESVDHSLAPVPARRGDQPPASLRASLRAEWSEQEERAQRATTRANEERVRGCGGRPPHTRAQRALVVGAGSMAALAAHTIADRGAYVTLVNRTLDKAERLAEAVGGIARPLAELSDALDHADIVVTCTGARGLRLTAADFLGTPVRGVVDLALPADVADEVGELPGVELVNLDVLARLAHSEAAGITDGLGAGTAEIAEAEALVASEVQDFLGLRRAAAVAPTVVALRSMAQDVMTAELARLDSRLPDIGERERFEIEQTVRRVVEKLLHQPTVRVKQLAAMPDSPDYAAALRELFALDAAVIDAVSQTR